MARNGSGVFNRGVADYVNGTVIDETAVNQEMDEIATALTASIATDGQTSNITANLPMNSKKFTGLTKGTARTDSATISNIADGTHNWITAGGSADVITGGMSPAITAYTTGMRISFVASGANTTNVTLNVDSVGAKAITKHGTTALVAGDIKSGQIVTVIYDGTQFLLETISDQVTDNILDGTTDFTKLDVDNITVDGNTISSTDTNGDITISPDGTGTVVIDTDLDVDNLNLNGNTIISTDTNGDVNITPNGTGDIVLDGVKWPQADGSAKQFQTTDGSAQLSYGYIGALNNTAAAIDLTAGSPTSVTLASSIPSGASYIQVYIQNFSTDTANQAPMIQIGDSGGLETTGYSGDVTSVDPSGAFVNSLSSGFLLSAEVVQDAADTDNQFFAEFHHMGSNIWVGTSRGIGLNGASKYTHTMCGDKTLTAVLDRIAITTSGGSATFDSGVALVMYR